jgi:adenylosuccinate lyase
LIKPIKKKIKENPKRWHEVLSEALWVHYIPSSKVDNIDEVTDVRLKALKEIEKDKARVVKAYNKKVKSKSFQVGKLV